MSRSGVCRKWEPPWRRRAFLVVQWNLFGRWDRPGETAARSALHRARYESGRVHRPGRTVCGKRIGPGQITAWVRRDRYQDARWGRAVGACRRCWNY